MFLVVLDAPWKEVLILGACKEGEDESSIGTVSVSDDPGYECARDRL